MSVRTSAGVDAYRAGDDHIFVAHSRQYVNPSKTPVIYVPGYNSNAIRLLQQVTGGSRKMLRAVGEHQPTLAIDAGGLATFGNDTAITAIGQAVTYFEATYDVTGPYLLVGTSMGFCDLMAWARANLANVVGAVAGQGLVDLTTAWNTPTDLGGGAITTDLINTAYGGAYDPLVHGPTHDPMMYADELTFPIVYFSASDDPFIPPYMATDFAAAAPDVDLYDIGAYGHGEAAHGQIAAHPALHTFLDTHGAA